MKTSETITKIAPALLKAQKNITFALMDKVNPHLKSKYADLPSVIDSIKTALNDAEIMFMQTPESMQDMHLQMTTRLIHNSGEWIESTMMMPLVKQDPQGYGSALTYARRYSLAAITGLYQDDDDGYKASNTAKAAKESTPKPQLDKERFSKAIKAIQDRSFKAEKLRADYSLTEEQELVLTDIGV